VRALPEKFPTKKLGLDGTVSAIRIIPCPSCGKPSQHNLGDSSNSRGKQSWRRIFSAR
jgi:hypothetical protein